MGLILCKLSEVGRRYERTMDLRNGIGERLQMREDEVSDRGIPGPQLQGPGAPRFWWLNLLIETWATRRANFLVGTVCAVFIRGGW